jgi:predicted RNA-binding Zn-ribbon protein involved in translation (DUF1610 family)
MAHPRYTEVRCWVGSDEEGRPKYNGPICGKVVGRDDWQAHYAAEHPLHAGRSGNSHAICPACGREAAQGGMRTSDRVWTYNCQSAGREDTGYWFE